MPSERLTLVLFTLFAIILLLALYGLFPHGKSAPDVEVSGNDQEPRAPTLFILIHGLSSGPGTWTSVRPALQPYGRVVSLSYDSSTLSNVDPVAVAERMGKEIERLYTDGGYNSVVLIGHSIGALIARRAYLNSAKAGLSWIHATRRIVLLAGMNRGWDVTGARPMDMSAWKRFYFWFGTWFGHLTNRGGLILSTEIGAPFVANLRLEWMTWFRGHSENTPIVVQLLGDIDDVVSDEDNKDLRAAAGSQFFWLKVRGTGHANIVDLSDSAGRTASYTGVGDYRKAKFLLAVKGTPEELEAQTEEQPPGTDPTVDHIVFVLHGIRDLGEWSADFEQQLRAIERATPTGRLRVVSMRYGYFSMASFLFRPDRQKFVRWFMDQYTETLARYPNAKTIDFFGHSNGTYLLASALQKYESMKIRRIVFAGSVVRRDYDWSCVFGRGQVVALRNYVATGDLVVALFPRFFEPKVMRWLGNDVGSAGFNGFQRLPNERFQNVAIGGGHSAFHSEVPQIAEFFTSDVLPVASDQAGARKGLWPALLHFQSLYAFWVVWGLLALLIGFPGVRVAVAAGPYALIPTLLYLGLVFAILKTV